MKRAAIYCRVSTIHHGQSVDMQLHDLRKLAEQRGFQIVKEYSDQGISGSKSSRPALDAMLLMPSGVNFRYCLPGDLIGWGAAPPT
jgi:DNA invertase Pin-like site-specific DNA recombinase